jgi:hypothetical protein
MNIFTSLRNANFLKARNGGVGASFAIFLGFTVSDIHLGFPTPSLQVAFC